MSDTLNIQLASIDWKKIAEAIAFYKSRDFVYVETPWIVSDAAINATIPAGGANFHVSLKNRHVGQLVASAEQGFIEKMIDGTLPLGRYMSASPCFRDDAIDEMHCREFFKVELIQTLDVDQFGVEDVSEEAETFFATLLPSIEHLNFVKTEQGFDLELGGIEIGSYGIREFRDFKWIYGTGLAEPRFSRARNALYGK